MVPDRPRFTQQFSFPVHPYVDQLNPCHPSFIHRVITPLVELGNAHVSPFIQCACTAELIKIQSIEITGFGPKAVSVTAESLKVALKEGRNLLKDRLTSVAERLVSPDVDAILGDERFRENLVLLGIDEAHILVPWGKDFRQAYHQISLLRLRLPSHTALIAVSATISPGTEFNSLCEQLEHKAGKYFLLSFRSRYIR